mmetsp:Transcript_86893/g.172497  ORF Transcript_86893/g.172497 Transcript_86893/m.172497 type:complete len:100 (+) Transcript_86893:384-683(+)
MEAKLEEIRGKVETIKAALESCTASDKISSPSDTEPVATGSDAVEETIPKATPTPNGRHLDEESDGEAAHDAPSSPQELPEAEVAQVAQPPPPPPPPEV